MARAKWKAPKTRAAKSRAARAIKKTSNLAHPCSEDCSLFSEPNVGEILDDELGQFPPTPPQHSKYALPCSNVAAHQERTHYICTNCSSLADTYLRNDPHGLLRGGHPARKGQRFFQLCKECKKVARESAKQGCFCFDPTLCFQCKCDKLQFATARRDAEVEHSRLGFVPSGEMVDGEWRFMRPVLNCLCWEEKLDVGDGTEGILRCAGCEGTVIKTDGRVWDPFAGEFVEVFG